MRGNSDSQNANAPQQPGAGQPLPPPLRHQMEATFGTDFSQVRIHSGHHAPALGALAYTHGNDIHLQPDPHGSRHPDPQFLAHELAHIVQQRAPGQVPTPHYTFKP